MANSTSQLSTFAQLFIYEQRSLASMYGALLRAVCGGVCKTSVAVSSRDGIKRVKAVDGVDNAIERLNAAIQKGFNQFEVVGKSNVGSMAFRFSCELSPLNADWSKIGEIGADRKCTQQELRLLWSSQSKEDYLRINKLSRDAVFISIESVWEGLDIRQGGKSLVDGFASLLSVTDAVLTRNYIGFIDFSPAMPATIALSGQPEHSKRIDSHFDRPHLVVFGPRLVMKKYIADIRELPAKPKFGTKALGKSDVVWFTDVQQLAKVDLPKWHEYSA